MVRWVIMAALTLVNCAPFETGPSGATPCGDPAPMACACATGARGTQRCEAGRYTPCQCDAATVDAAADAAPPSPNADADADADAEDATPAIDATAPPPAPVICEGLEVIDFFADADAENGRWRLRLDASGSGPVETAGCGGGAKGVVVGVRAPYDGYWIVGTGGPDTDFDPVLGAHVACPGLGPEAACVDDDETFAPTLAGYLAAGEVRHFVVTGWTSEPSILDLVVVGLPLVGVGATCSLGAGVACAADHVCAPSVEDATRSVCEPRTPPVLEDGVAYRRDEDQYTLSLTGRDASRDIWGIAIQFLDEADTPITLDAQTMFYAEAPSRPRTAEFRLGYRFSGLSQVPGVRGIDVALVDTTGAESERRVLPLVPIPTVGRADACDPEGVLDQCPQTFVCHPSVADCRPARAPTLTEGAFYLNREEHSWGIRLSGVDENADVVTLRFLVLDRRRQRIELNGADVGDLLIGDDLVVEEDGWRFTYSGALPRSVDPGEVGFLQLIMMDATGLSTLDETLPVSQGPEIERGAPCDSALVLDRCARGTRCRIDALDEYTCGVAVHECPVGAEVPPLAVDETISGSTFSAGLSLGHLTCAAGIVGLDAYQFVAPEAGDYTLALVADFEAIGYVTRSCSSVRFTDELACVVGETARATLSLAAGERVYLRIGGVFTERETDEVAYKRSRGHYQLTIERPP